MTALPSFLSGSVLVAGAGISGRGCARMLTQLGVDVTLADNNPDAFGDLPGIAADEVNPADFDLVVTSPGWRPDSPLLVACAEAGLEVFGEPELAYRLDRAGVFGAPRTWMVVTGTNGKTTTTGMLAEMMQAQSHISGLRAQAVGNIGFSIFDALDADERVDILVVELSSYQLHWSTTLTPDIGVLLNLADDHLDWHGSFEEYAQAKAKVLRAPIAVVGADDARVMDYAAAAEPEVLIGFTAGQPQAGQVGVIDNQIVAYQVAATSGSQTAGSLPLALASATGIQPSGLAGILDATAAAAAARAAGATPEAIAAGLAAYRVEGHRGAEVHHLDGVSYIDNSKATNPHAADAALRGVDNVVWLAGGQLKGAAVDELISAHAKQLRAAVLIGQDRDVLAHALAQGAPHVPVTVIDSTDPVQAMEAAVKACAQAAQPGDTVLLAPAGASYDMYTGLAQRGDLFAAAARRLSSKT